MVHYIEGNTFQRQQISYLFFFLATTHSLWDPVSETRDWTQALSSECLLSQPLDHQGISSYPVLLSSFKPSRRQWDTVSTSKTSSSHLLGASQVTQVKNPLANAEDLRDLGSIPGLGKSPGEGNGNPLQYFLPGKSHGQRNLAGYSPHGRTESDTTEVT